MRAAAGTAAPEAGAREINFGFRFLAPLAFGSLLNPINSTMISTALGPIRSDFHTSVAQTAWLIAGLYLASAIAQPTLGRMADVFGPRRIYLFGLCVVGLAGLASLWAPTLSMLIWVRVALGIGTSAAYPSAMHILRTQSAKLGSPPPRKALSILSLTALSTLAIGPTLGGVLTGLAGWRSIFVVKLPVALIGIAMVLAWTPKDEPRSASSAQLLAGFDFTGILLFGASLLSAMFFLMGLDHPRWFLLPLVAVAATGLVLHSLRRPQPFIDVRMLLRNRPLATTYARVGAYSVIGYSMLYGYAQWLESGPGFGSAKAGLVTLPMSLVAGACSLAGARTKGIRGPLIFGTAAMLAGCIALLLLHSASGLWLLVAVMMLFGIPQGLCNISNQAAMYVQAPAAEIGAAAGLLRTAVYIGAIVSSSLLGLVYGGQPDDHGLHRLAIVMCCLAVPMLILTIADRTLPRAALKQPTEPAATPSLPRA